MVLLVRYVERDRAARTTCRIPKKKNKNRAKPSLDVEFLFTSSPSTPTRGFRGAHLGTAGTARSDMASAVAPPPSAPPRLAARTPDPARFSGAPRATPAHPAHPGDDHLARVVEHLERELSRREASERGLARELDAARADIAERDAQIEDICAQWERSVTQMQAARDEDVRRVSERLAFVERAEVPALRAQMEQCETRLMRAQASAESLAAKLERAEAEVRSLAADGERRDAIAAAEAAAAARESDALARDAERRRETELAALRARFERVLREKEASFDIERERTRKNVDAVVAGAVADERLRSEAIAGARAALDSDPKPNRTGRSRETNALRAEKDGVDHDVHMRVSEDGPADLASLRANEPETRAETSPEESRMRTSIGPSPERDPTIDELPKGSGDPSARRLVSFPSMPTAHASHAASVASATVTVPATVTEEDSSGSASVTVTEKTENASFFSENAEIIPTPPSFSAPRPSPKPRVAPPPLPVPARAAHAHAVTPVTDRGPTYVPSALVPPPPPR